MAAFVVASQASMAFGSEQGKAGRGWMREGGDLSFGKGNENTSRREGPPDETRRFGYGTRTGGKRTRRIQARDG